MLLIAYAVVHDRMRRSVVGALATDRVVPPRSAPSADAKGAKRP
jgi:hypothetical protein